LLLPPSPSVQCPLIPYTTLFRSVKRDRLAAGFRGRFARGGLRLLGRFRFRDLCRFGGSRDEFLSAVERVIEVESLGRNFGLGDIDRKSTRLNSSHQIISYDVFCL